MMVTLLNRDRQAISFVILLTHNKCCHIFALKTTELRYTRQSLVFTVINTLQVTWEVYSPNLSVGKRESVTQKLFYRTGKAVKSLLLCIYVCVSYWHSKVWEVSLIMEERQVKTTFCLLSGYVLYSIFYPSVMHKMLCCWKRLLCNRSCPNIQGNVRSKSRPVK